MVPPFWAMGNYSYMDLVGSNCANFVQTKRIPYHEFVSGELPDLRGLLGSFHILVI
jgi:hypothetical protein